MNDLYWMITIIERNSTDRFTKFYETYGASVSFVSVGRGTATSEVLDFLGLEISEKAVIFSAVTYKVWKAIRYGLQNRMRIDVPGTGIAFIVPFSSVGGKKALAALTCGQEFVKGEESVLKDTKYELLVTITNQGYTDLVMDAARSSGAGGGTIIHAKGTGVKEASHFMGVALAAEKEIVLIVAKSAEKNTIMKAIMEEAGPDSKARAIVFSLPVTETAGMRLLEAECAEAPEENVD